MSDSKDSWPERMPSELVERVENYAQRESLWREGDRVLVACSGGTDSLALLAVLRAGASAWGLTLGVAHVDHGLRAESAEDARFVDARAAELGLPFFHRRLELASPPGGGPVSEDAARRGRLAALAELAEEFGADAVALGHTANDQLETLLMRLVRGAGLTGMAGMAPRRDRLVRPLLALTREELEAVVAAAGWAAREDPSNQASTYLRSRLRRDVVPLLERENPKLLAAVTRTAAVLREAEDSLQQQTAKAAAELGEADGAGWALPGNKLRAQSPAIQTRLIRWFWRELRAGGEGEGEEPAELTHEHVESVLKWGGPEAEDAGTTRVELPGRISALWEYGRLVLFETAELRDPGEVSLPIPGPGRYTCPALDLAIEVREWAPESASTADGDVPDPKRGPFGEYLFYLSELSEGLPAGEAWPLILRNRRPGDRVVSAVGRRKVSDLMIDRRAPRYRRARWPLLVWDDAIVLIPAVWTALVAQVGDRPKEISGSPSPPYVLRVHSLREV